MLLMARSGLGYLDSAMLRATFVPPGAGCRFCAGSHGWGLGLSDWLPCLGVCFLGSPGQGSICCPGQDPGLRSFALLVRVLALARDLPLVALTRHA